MQHRSNKPQVDSPYRHNASIIKVISLCLAAVIVFMVGFVLRGNNDLLSALGMENLSVETQANPGETVSGNTYDSISARLAEVQGIIANDSIDEYDLSSTTTSIMDAFVASLHDPYARYFDETSYVTYLNGVSNAELGIGVLFGELDGRCMAVDVFADSPAAAAGVQAGDFVDSIDGVHKDNWTTPEVVNALARDEGESVYITWQRPSQQGSNDNTFTTSLVYTAQTEDNITYRIEDGIAVITLKQIGSDSASVMRQTITQAQQDGAQGFVLDLRNVPGGYLTQAVEIASLFIPSGTVVQIQTNETTTTKSADGESITSLPLVVMVNDKTAGSAEVLAVALQDSQRAQIVGVQTQGKGSVQVMQPLSFGGALRYTAATYLSPSGRSIDGVGVDPDVVISSLDRQEMIAREIAQSELN